MTSKELKETLKTIEYADKIDESGQLDLHDLAVCRWAIHRCMRYDAALRKIAKPALGGKYQQLIAQEALGEEVPRETRRGDS